VAKLLLERGADINAIDNQGRTALMWAAWNGRPEVVKLLLANKANVGIKDREGQTATSLAREYQQDDIVKMLQKAGAPPEKVLESPAR
jgi:ankyrin repeat protein